MTVHRIRSLQEVGEGLTLCPYKAAKCELCLAARASSMIDRHGCISSKYKDCAIFAIKRRRGDKCGW